MTIYQMELPYNTTISADLIKGGGRFGSVAGWQAGHAGCPNVERLRRAP